MSVLKGKIEYVNKLYIIKITSQNMKKIECKRKATQRNKTIIEYVLSRFKFVRHTEYGGPSASVTV
jgi:hypothetical protein